MKRYGYTLIELLVVIAIIGILSGLGTYGWSSASARSRDSVRKTDLAQIKDALAHYYLDNKEYPDFDATHGRIYNAVWQLSAGTTCAHNTDIAKRLTPTYLQKIPEDPRQRTDFAKHNCSMTAGQDTRYLYLSAPSESSGPSSPANGFALLATLERAGTDQLADLHNPLMAGNDSFFGVYYSNATNYGNGSHGVDANYMITAHYGR